MENIDHSDLESVRIYNNDKVGNYQFLNERCYLHNDKHKYSLIPSLLHVQ